MNRRAAWISCLAIWAALSGLLSGCLGSRELNSLSIVLAMGIDKVGDEYEVSVQIIDASQMSRTRMVDRSVIEVFAERSPTIFEAVRKFTTQSSRELYFSHMRFLLFDEATAEEGIRRPIDLLVRDSGIRPDFHIAIVKGGRAKDLMELVTPTEVLPAMDLYKSLKLSEQSWAPTAAVNVKDLLMMMASEGMSLVLTGVKFEGDIERGKTSGNVKQPKIYGDYRYTGIGVFREDRLVGWMDEEESKAVTYIANKVYSTVAHVKCPMSDGDFVVEVRKVQVHRKPRLVDNQPLMRLNVDVDANIAEVECNVDVKDEKSIQSMQQVASEELEEVLRAGIRKAQKEFEADVFGFGETFHRRYPKRWHRWERDWPAKFKAMPVEISIDYHLRRHGKIINPVDNFSDEGG